MVSFERENCALTSFIVRAVPFQRENSVSTSFVVRAVSLCDFSTFCITSFGCNIVILPSRGYWCTSNLNKLKVADKVLLLKTL